MAEKKPGTQAVDETQYHPSDYTFEEFDIAALSYSFILKHSLAAHISETGSSFDLHPQAIERNAASFTRLSSGLSAPTVTVKLSRQALQLSCPCPLPKSHLCAHQAQVLLTIMNRPDIRVFFDDKLRAAKIQKVAVDYGLENEEKLDDYFLLEYKGNAALVKPRLKELLPVNKEKMAWLHQQLVPPPSLPVPEKEENPLQLAA